MNTIFDICKTVDQEIPGDFGGGSLLPKTFLMAYLVQEQNLKNYIEIGIYKGRSLFPAAYSIHLNGGESYGIDPYSADCAKEEDVNAELKAAIDDFIVQTDFEKLYADVLVYREKCGYGDSLKIFKMTSDNALPILKERNISADLVHIDGNHDTAFVKSDYEGYYDILSDGGFFVFDDINWDSVKVIYEQAKKECVEVFRSETFGILLKEKPSIERTLKIEKLERKLEEAFKRTEQYASWDSHTPEVAIGIMTYNHVDYIEKCINSVIRQEGKFNKHIVICDDCSSDRTSEKIYAIYSKIEQTDKIRISYYRNEKNIGAVNNFKKMVGHLENSDFFTFCEGDDYYLSCDRIQEHLDLLTNNPQYGMSFNKLLFYFQDTGKFEAFNELPDAPLTTEKLAATNFIGNFSSCFYNSRALSFIKSDLFDMFTVDWMFNIFVSQYGDIGLVNEPLNVYRKHGEGVWAGKSEDENRCFLKEQIDEYNAYLDFTYDASFNKMRDLVTFGEDGESFEEFDLTIVDDIFPHPVSGFRFQEFSSILENIPNSQVLTNGLSAKCLGEDTIHELLVDYKRKNRDKASRVHFYDYPFPLKTKLFYCVFLQNIHHYTVERAEELKVPFIFTLYPGGRFALDTEDGDAILKRVFDSPYFKKVIVTQKTTYDYLLDKHFCEKEDIEFIFGVVIPHEKLALEMPEKKHYGIDKDTLDICFVAHKYTENGEDKGYDTFIETARMLSGAHDNVTFHVVGPWDEEVLDIDGITDIRFYGTQEQDWFDDFYVDKDIILSPNVPGKIFKGCFDGFPTATSTDAALRKVAMFCTDPLKMNDGYFEDNKEIVIVDHDAQNIAEKIEYYIENPLLLKELCENGCKKVKDIYSYEKQIAPRIRLLKDAIAEPFEPREPRVETIEEPEPEPEPEPVKESLFKRAVKKVVPLKIRKVYHKMNRIKQRIKQI